MKKIVGVSFLSFWICVCSLAQTQIYVSPRGNDKAEGTLKKPLRTIQAAVDKASQKKDADVEIILRGGAYELDRTVEIGKGLCFSADKTLWKGSRFCFGWSDNHFESFEEGFESGCEGTVAASGKFRCT